MSTRSTSLTKRQRFWLRHLRACGSGSLAGYAAAHGLSASSLYEARSRLKRKGVLPGAPAPRFARVEPVPRGTPPALCRIHLRNGVVVELACEAEHWPAVLEGVAALP